MNKRLHHIIASRHILAAFMSLFLLSAVSSCSEDENPETGKATVKMTFTTRAGAQTGSVSALEERERMQTLRVIMENASIMSFMTICRTEPKRLPFRMCL